MLRTLATAKL